AIETKIAVDVIFDQGDLIFGEHLHQALLFFVGHATAERVAEVRRENAGFDPAALQTRFQLVEADAMTGEGRDFTDAHAERLDDLQDAEEGGGLDGDDVTGFGDRAQAEVEGFGGPDGGNDIIGSEHAAGFHGAPGDLDPESMVSRGRIETVGRDRRTAPDRGGDAIELTQREQFGGRQGGAQADEIGIAPGLDDLENQVADLDLDGSPGGLGHGRFGRWSPALPANVIPGLGPGFDDAAAFEQPVSLHDRGDADLLLLAAFANGRHAFPGAKRAVFDQFRDPQGDLPVQASFVFDLRCGV